MHLSRCKRTEEKKQFTPDSHPVTDWHMRKRKGRKEVNPYTHTSQLRNHEPHAWYLTVTDHVCIIKMGRGLILKSGWSFLGGVVHDVLMTPYKQFTLSTSLTQKVKKIINLPFDHTTLCVEQGIV